MQFVNHNGSLVSENEPVFGIENRGFRYGDALFETIRIYNGQACFFTDHFNRLKEGLQLLEMKLTIDQDQLLSELNRLIQANNIAQGGRVRITVYRNSGGFYTPENDTTSYVIEASEISDNAFVLNDKGLTIDLYEKHRKTINELAAVKSTNCLTYILAGKYKQQKGLDDCVLLNELGSIAECVSSNLFVAYNGVLYTPSTNQGIIPGIMRQKIIDVSKKLGIEVQECPLSPQVLIRADEVFLTNAIWGINWVGAYRTKRYFNKVSQRLTQALNQEVSLKMGQRETSPS